MAVNISVTFPCKPYVRVFVQQNFGSPTRFYNDKSLMTLVRLMLQAKDSSLNYREINPDIYCDKVTFFINENDFNHYGCILSNQGIMDLNRCLENKVKTLMRAWCQAQFTYGMTAIDSVKKFQTSFGFPEHIWKAESIYKDCQRNNVFQSAPANALHEKIHTIILSQMSRNRTITNQGKLTYEEN